MNNQLGAKISPILTEIQHTLLQNYETKPNFTKEGLIAGIFIFQSVVMDKMFELQDSEDIPLNIREDMATKCGYEIRDLIKKYCNIDTHQLFNIN